MRLSIYILLLFIFIACSHDPVPKGIIAPNRMEKVVYDLLKVDEYINNFLTKDTTINLKTKRSLLYEQVFKLHETNRKDFYLSYKYYQQHPDLQKTLFDSITANASRANVTPPHVVPAKRLTKNK